MSEGTEPVVLFFEYGTRLILGPNDSLVLNVLCGRVGQYGVEFALNAEEVASYKAGGDSFLRTLSANVQANPNAFAQRGRLC
jgi:hypothetical protein